MKHSIPSRVNSNRIVILALWYILNLGITILAQEPNATDIKELPEVTFGKELSWAIEQISESYVRKIPLSDLLNYTVHGLYKSVKKPIPKEIRALLSSTKKLSILKIRQILIQARHALGNDKKLANKKDIALTMKSLVSRIGPWSRYEPDYNPHCTINRRWTGIGIQLRRHPARDCLEVVTPYYNSPAFKMGLRGRDLIHEIILGETQWGRKLKKPSVFSTKSMSVKKAYELLNGQWHTQVRLRVEYGDGFKAQNILSVPRREFIPETVYGYQRDIHGKWNFVLEAERRIVYVRFATFDVRTFSALRTTLAEVAPDGIHGLILDLRFHPGGLIPTVYDIAGLFTEKNPVTTIRGRYIKRVIESENGGKYKHFPMICLVNSQTTSTSEMLAACLQDHDRALIVGERTQGKASIQNVSNIGDGALMLTTATFRRPSGKFLDRAESLGRPQDEWGVTPDKGLQLKLRNEKERKQLQRNLEERTHIKRKRQPSTFRDRQLELALTTLKARIKEQ